MLGKTFSKAALAAVSGSSDGDLDALLAALVRKEVLSLQVDPRSPERGQYSFLQDLLRQVAYETLSRKERRVRHLAAAAHLEQRWQDGDEELVEIVAAHVLSALQLDPEAGDAGELRKARRGPSRPCGRTGCVAGRERERPAVRRAGARALRESPAPRRAPRAGWGAGPTRAQRRQRTCPLRASDRPASRRSSSRIRLRASTAWLGIVTWQLEDDIERAIGVMERAFSVLEGDERDPDLATVAVQLARALYFSGRVDDSMERNELALEIAEELVLPDVLSHGLNTKSLILYARGRLIEATVLMRYALDFALMHDRSEAALRAYNNLTSFLAPEDLREALEHTVPRTKRWHEGWEIAVRCNRR